MKHFQNKIKIIFGVLAIFLLCFSSVANPMINSINIENNIIEANNFEIKLEKLINYLKDNPNINSNTKNFFIKLINTNYFIENIKYLEKEKQEALKTYIINLFNVIQKQDNNKDTNEKNTQEFYNYSNLVDLYFFISRIYRLWTTPHDLRSFRLMVTSVGLSLLVLSLFSPLIGNWDKMYIPIFLSTIALGWSVLTIYIEMLLTYWEVSLEFYITDILTGEPLSGLSVNIIPFDSKWPPYIYANETERYPPGYYICPENQIDDAFGPPPGKYHVNIKDKNGKELYNYDIDGDETISINGRFFKHLPINVNHKPEAFNDEIEVIHGGSVNIVDNRDNITKIFSLLGNDKDKDVSDTIYICNKTNPSEGKLFLYDNGTFLYQHWFDPDVPSQYNDSFIYWIIDNTGSEGKAQVNISIKKLVARNDYVKVDEGKPIKIDVLENDEIVNQSSDILYVEIIDWPEHYDDFILNGDNTITYKHDGYLHTEDHFTYKAVSTINEDLFDLATVYITINQTYN